ncbi:hypothetical protein NP493_1474g00018 [Ridgeia piscesae]|uniref:Uncharacterized protein n=1 Tax=Ridgeia piscesae TaxID=27915 RepID=A0AAD9K3E6_RIDPI|nr:hypothetical protein NP493_1474g00018 [Ridgeia piscesae]
MGSLLSICFTSKGDEGPINQQHVVKRRCQQQQQQQTAGAGSAWGRRPQLSVDIDSARGAGGYNSTSQPSPRHDFPTWSPRPSPSSPAREDPRRPDRPFFEPPQSYKDQAETDRRSQSPGRGFSFNLTVGGNSAHQQSKRRRSIRKNKRRR